MKSPFKFLDAYTPEDSKSFFGRDDEIELLYNLIYKSRLLLVYGQSGTGKTSLVQCGLGSRFDETDWFPFLIRRNDNINSSLTEALTKAVDGSLRKNSIPETIGYIYKNYLRPVYLIFDQLEELFILGKAEEQLEFINTISKILNSEQPCKILLVMREEYIAYLYQFEQTIPTLFDRRMRVEPMSYGNVENVITGSCTQFNITLEDKKSNTQQIIKQVGSGRSGIQLPYLQVYLDRLWREDFDRTYPNGYTASNDVSESSNERGSSSSNKHNNTNTSFPALHFTTKEIEELGEIEEVLEKFLRQQTKDIQHHLKATYPSLPNDCIRQILDIFVSEEGTKQPVQYKREGEDIILEEPFGNKLGHLPKEALAEALNNLELARILRFTESLIELAHDSLADLIDKERSTEQRQLNQIKQRISAAYVEQRETSVFLNERQLLSIEEFLPRLKMNLPPHLLQFIKDSEADAAEKRQEEKSRHERELKLTKEKLVAEQQAAKRQRMLTIVFGLAFIGSLFLGGVSYYLNEERHKAEASEESQRIEKEKTDLENERINLENEALKKRNEEFDKLEKERRDPKDKPITLQYIKDAPLMELIRPRTDIDKIMYVDDAGRQNYKFKLWLDMPKIRQKDISEVRYFFNHPTFHPKVKKWGDRRFGGKVPDFAIKYQGFSCLQNVQVWITHKNSGAVDTLNLSMCNALNDDQ
jgi:hypothetical protein